MPDGDREIVYVGGGAGMAPIRSHLLYLFETAADHPRGLATGTARGRGRRFSTKTSSAISKHGFQTSASTSRSRRHCQTTSGLANRLHSRRAAPRTVVTARHPKAAEYYVCGPPVMVKATRDMLRYEFGVALQDIAADEF